MALLPQDQLDSMVQAGNSVADNPQQPANGNPPWLQSMLDAGLKSQQSAAVLGHATALAQNSFQTPLTNMASGQSGNNMDVAIGAGKQALSDLSMAGAQNAGPVGKDMLAHAPAFAHNIDSFNQAMKPSNISQAVGGGLTTVAEGVLPLGSAKVSNAVKGVADQGGSLLSKLADSTGVTKFLEDRAFNKTISAVSPKLTAGEMEASPNVMRPRIGAPTVDFSKDKAIQAIANDTHGIVKGKSAIDDKNALRTAIESTSEQGVKPFLSENKAPANFEDLQKKLSLIHPQSSLKADPSAFKTYDRVREEVQASLYNSLKQAAKGKGDFGGQVDFNDVWDARKILDSKAEEELGSKVFGTPEFTGAKSAIQDMRQGLTQYIKDSLQFPGQMEDVNKMQEFIQVARGRGIDIGSKEAQGLMEQMGIKTTPEAIAKAKMFEDSMSKISNYYKAMDNVSTKIPDEIRSNATFGKRHPVLKWVGRGLGVGTGIGIEEQARKAI